MKAKNRKYLKVGMSTVGVLGFVGLIIGVSTSWNNIITISASGSSAVQPLMNIIANNYKEIDLVTQSGGSGAGINAILTKSREIGMSSKDPEAFLKDTNNWDKGWKNEYVKTITIAWDGIAILYKPNNPNENFDLNEESIAKLYSIFSGVKIMNMSDLGLKGNNIITPYARLGGGDISGTADAFLHDSNINFEKSQFWRDNLSDKEKQEIKFILKNGNYGSNVEQTSEANSQAWQRAKNGPVGSIIYLSTGFVLNNMDEIKKNGFKVATYNKESLNIDTITSGYNWFRPFNLMTSLKNIKDETKRLIEWILFDEKSKEIIKNEGYIPISIDQISSMKIYRKNNKNWNFENSDYSLGFSGARAKGEKYE